MNIFTIWLIFTQSRPFSNSPFSILECRKVQHLIFIHSANYLERNSLPLFTQPTSIQVEEERCEEVEVEKCQEVKDQKCQVVDEEMCETKEKEKCKEVEEEVCEQVKEEKCSVEEKEECTVKEEEQCRIETTEQCKQVQNHSKDASISVAFWYSGILVFCHYGIVVLW